VTAGCAAAAGGVLVVATWWWGAPAPRGAGAAEIDAGRLVGLLAGYVALLQVLLRARIPLVERGLGTDRINAGHRALGPYLLVLLVAHVLLITVGYAGAAGVGPPRQIWTLVTTYRYVDLAAVGLLLIAVAGVTTWRRLRARMPYEWWYLVHLTVYGGLALALLHQVSVGEHLRRHGAVRLAWIAVYAAAAAVVAGRFLRPVYRSARHRLVVDRVVPEAPGVVSVWIRGDRLDRLRVAGGQFFRWRFLAPGMWPAANPYSVSGREGDTLRITVKEAGDHSTRMALLAPGTRVVAEGPGGGLTAARARGRAAVLLAGGVGITPLRALLPDLAATTSVCLIYRARSDEQVLFRDELDRLVAARPGCVHYLVGPRASGRNRLGPADLTALCPTIRDREVYLCGPPGFTDRVRRSLRELGVPAARLHAETFRM
jgi:predicted ferric reductase